MVKKAKKGGKLRGCLKVFLIVVILLALVAGGLFVWGWNSIVPNRDDHEEHSEFREDRINVLVVGTDNGGVSHDTGRADSIMVFNLDLKNQKVVGVSIPRDSRVMVPGHHETKINHSYAYGGIDLTKETVESVLGIPIDYYALTNFAGFEKVVEILGGVTIDVERKMRTHTYYGNIDLEPGVQKLNAQEALGYVRYRYDAGGDVARGQRQQKFLKAVFEEVMSTQGLIKLPQLLTSITEFVETDLTVPQLTYLAATFMDIDMDTEFLSMSPEVSYAMINGGSYAILDDEALAEMIQTYFINDYDPVAWGIEDPEGEVGADSENDSEVESEK